MQYKQLNKQRVAPPPVAAKKDKCAEQKRSERDLKEALKSQRNGELEKRRDEEEAKKSLIKEERMFHGPTSRRAREDLRSLGKKVHKAEAESTVCEHGVNKCRICHPPVVHKAHHHLDSVRNVCM